MRAPLFFGPAGAASDPRSSQRPYRRTPKLSGERPAVFGQPGSKSPFFFGPAGATVDPMEFATTHTANSPSHPQDGRVHKSLFLY